MVTLAYINSKGEISMKTWSNIAIALVMSVFVAGCASDSSDRRGVDQTGDVVSDSWITTKVKSDLAVEKDVSATHISVKTVEGVVTLSGSATSQAEAEKAVRVASEIKGVKSVVNNIEVKS
jgi:hyperosmotically inducible protein